MLRAIVVAIPVNFLKLHINRGLPQLSICRNKICVCSPPSVGAAAACVTLSTELFELLGDREQAPLIEPVSHRDDHLHGFGCRENTLGVVAQITEILEETRCERGCQIS